MLVDMLFITNGNVMKMLCQTHIHELQSNCLHHDQCHDHSSVPLPTMPCGPASPCLHLKETTTVRGQELQATREFMETSCGGTTVITEMQL